MYNAAYCVMSSIQVNWFVGSFVQILYTGHDFLIKEYKLTLDWQDGILW